MTFLMPPSNESPDVFVLAELHGQMHIFCGYYSSYLGADSWRLSTPMKMVEKSPEDQIWMVETESGSKYTLNLNKIGYSSTSASIKTSILQELTEETVKFHEDASEIKEILENLLAAK